MDVAFLGLLRGLVCFTSFDFLGQCTAPIFRVNWTRTLKWSGGRCSGYVGRSEETHNFVYLFNYNIISKIPGERDGSCLELSRRSYYMDYSKLQNIITYVIWYTYCINMYCVYKNCIRVSVYTVVQQ